METGGVSRSDDSVFGNTSSTSVTVGKFEVFLSFRGIDTRKGFTDFLYKDLVDAGIRTYLDDDELRVGEEIGPELMKAIEESKICIPILSPNYASSKWCLLGLAQMVECKRSTKLNIKPIFYDVEPCDCDVNNRTGSYEEAFRQHEKRFDKETVQRWKEALEVVGGLRGWDLKKDTNGHQGKLVKIVAGEVLSQLKKNYMVVTDNLVGIDHHLVGIDHHVGEMKRLLNVDSNDVWIVGICGMGGLGKTTIAKFVYSELSECFDCCCFLADVREMAKQDSSLVNLQKQLISKIRKGRSLDIANVDEGINMIKGMACKKKVLIVLDDVDNESQFAKLVGKCNQFGSGSRIIVTTRNKGVLNALEVDKMYEPHLMGCCHALQLFSRHAFRSDFPPEDYDILSKEIVSTTGGLPLALEIIGSLLFGKCEEIWEETLEKLKDIPDDQVQKCLRISYDALNYEEKQIFLDIACFFIGENKTLPFYMWNDCKYYPTSGLNILVLRSLVKIGDDNEFRMHDQLRDFGRQIIRQENIENPRERSRLWICEEALDVLDRKMGTKNVEALCLQEYSGEHSFTNDEFGKLPNLRFLRVDHTVLTGGSKNLLSKLRWLQWRMCTDNSKPINFHLKNLVILDLKHSCITENWEGWSQIKVAKKLKVLDLSFCKDLTRTPDLSNLVMLKGLDLSECDQLVEVRGLMGLKSLENLDMRHCTSLERLPDLSNLVMLKSLNLSSCNKLVEVRGLAGLKSLENLDLVSCGSLERLPDQLNSVMLKKLNLARCSSLERLPDLSNLVMLKGLNLSRCGRLVEVRGLTGLKSLEMLDMRGCGSLERLPDLSNLVMLKGLRLCGCGKLVEVRGLTGLKSLEMLDMSWCGTLESLPDLSNLVMLKGLRLCGCGKLVEVRGLTGLKSLEMLDMSWCGTLESLPDLSNLVMLKGLNLSTCGKLVEVRGLTGLKSLEMLDMDGCGSLERLPDLSNLVMLKGLRLSWCDKLVEVRGLTGLKSLEMLDMRVCKSLERLPDLSNLVMLKGLCLYGCDKLVEVRGLTGLKSLEMLDMSGCESLERLPDLSNLVMLKGLCLFGCDKLVEVRGLTGLKSLEMLDMGRCGSLERLPGLSNLVMLKGLSLFGCDKLVDIFRREEIEKVDFSEWIWPVFEGLHFDFDSDFDSDDY